MLWFPDSLEYDRLGRNLAFHGVFSQSPAPPLLPDWQRVPLFPAQVGIAYLILGDRPSVAVPVAVAGNVLLGAVTAALVTRLGTIWGGSRVGLLAGLVLAADVTSIAYASMLLSEVLFTLLLTASLIVMARYGVCPQPSLAAFAGGLVGLATLTRPIGILLPLTLIPVFLLIRSPRRWLLALRDVGLCTLLFAVLVVPWGLRGRASGGTDAVTKQAAINAYFHRGALIQGELTGQDPEVVRADLETTFAREAAAKGWTEQEQVRVMQERAARLLRSNLGLYLRLQVDGMLKLLGPDTDAIFDVLGLRTNQHDPPARSVSLWWTRFGMVQLLLVYGLATAGVVTLLRARRWFPLVVLLLPAAYLMVSAGPEAYARFRVPLMPAFAVLAAIPFLYWRSDAPETETGQA